MSETKWTKVKCSKCEALKNTNPKAYEARLAKFEGSVERMEKEWICRECSQEGKEVKIKPESTSQERRKEILKKAKKEAVKNIPLAEEIHEEESVQLEETLTPEEF